MARVRFWHCGMVAIVAACGSRSGLLTDESSPAGSGGSGGASSNCAPAPKPVTLLASNETWWSLVGDEHNVYATLLDFPPNGEDYALVAIDKCSGHDRVVGKLTPTSASLPPVVNGPDGVYFTARLYPSTDIFRVNATGAVDKVGSIVPDIAGLAVDNDNFYVLTYDDTSFMFQLSAISRVGGTATLLVPESVNLANPIVDGGTVYFGSGSGMSRVGVKGGPVTVLSNAAQPCRGDDRAGNLVVDATYLYWRSLDGNVWRTTKSDGTTLSLAQTGGCGGLGLDADRVYFGNFQGGIDRVAKTGGAVEHWQKTAHGVDGIVVDTDSVYWAALGYDVSKRDH